MAIFTIDSTRWKRWRTSMIIFFSVLGPGIITANVDNDAGGIFTYSVAGARYGYSLLWSLIPITVALIVVQEMVARMGVVTGKGLADLIREEYGFRATFILMIVLLLTNWGNTVSEFAGLASGMSLFHVSRFISVPLGAMFVWLLVVRGSSRTVEKVFLTACFFYVSYLISGFMSHPTWKQAALGTFRPMVYYNADFLYIIIGLVGTTIAPWMQFYLQASIVEKGIKLKNYKQSRWDVILGCIIVDVVAFFIILACAATIFESGHQRINNAADAALALKPMAGSAASALFAFGLCNASLFAASILPLATAYTVCEGLGFESGIDKRVHEAPAFYSLYTGLIILGAIAVLVLSEIKQVPIILFSQVANGILLPFILIFMLRLCNREDLMGPYRNTRAFNIIAWTTCIVLILLTLVWVIMSFIPQYIPKQ
jgi:NRAMP (natural resistance-associated macrophage protein)-like metal ion transporter